jgi:hypothetical protein
MFFGSRRRHKSGRGVSHTSGPAGNDAGRGQSQQWDSWWHAAQKVTRAWNEWLAADRRERTELWRCYVSALDGEERAAAEVERQVNLAAKAHEQRDCIVPTANTRGNTASCG